MKKFNDIVNEDSLLSVSKEEKISLSIDIFKSIPNISILENEIFGDYFFVRHNLDTALFRSVEPIVCIFMVEGIDLEIFETTIEKFKQEKRFLNCIILVVNEHYDINEWKREASIMFQSDIKLLQVKMEDLIEIWNAEDRADKLEEIILL